MALNESRSKLRFDKEYSGLEQTFDCEIEPLKYRPRNFRKIDTVRTFLQDYLFYFILFQNNC